MPVRRLLVANRGEIALRIFRTCRELEVEAVAVAAPDDRGSLHARSADMTVEIASYLDAAELVRAARESGADAVHPGYGFLAESPELAELVLAAGLTWIGPPVAALRLGGDKLQAKRVACQAGVPTVPEAEKPPLLVKAAAGGGGRGMRIVRDGAELEAAIESARREAWTAFGDDRIYLERYLDRPRHVEVQLLADRHGTVAALGTRDCSIQRRHQKLLEEAPPPHLAPGLRDLLADAAIAFARAIGYESAGTAEFVVAGEELFFLELNARIQVEHPVTELVTGIDLVAEQLRVATGEPLAPHVARPRESGHAIEARLYAEDPITFLPQAGRIGELRLPEDVRVDAAVEAGDEIGTAYDPLLAKIVAHGETREEALARLGEALARTAVHGITTNLPLLQWLARHPVVRAGRATTAFLLEHSPLTPPPAYAADGAWQGAWRLNLAAPPPHARTSSDAAAAERRAPGVERSMVAAPMPGTAIRVLVAAGDRVRAQQPLVVLEAMKMEMPLVAPYEATVLAVHVAPGDRVAGRAPLVELEE